MFIILRNFPFVNTRVYDKMKRAACRARKGEAFDETHRKTRCI